MRAQRGGVQVASEPGKGSRFRLLFPAAAGMRPEDPAAPPESEPLPEHYRGSGTVLLVDDEAPLRTAAAQALQRVGFAVLEAGNGLEALRVSEANFGQIRLIVLDLIMPRMNGEEVYRALRSRGLLVPVILTSGFSASDVGQCFHSKGIAGFLQKPYPLQTLVRTVRQVLAREEPGSGAGVLGARKPPLPPADLDLTGCPTLDRQHLELLEAFNRLVETVDQGGRREHQERALSTLSERALVHFGMEDTLMGRMGYPWAREHQMNHARLIGHIKGLISRFQAGSLVLTPALVDFLECWVVHHTQEDDSRLAHFLKARGH